MLSRSLGSASRFLQFPVLFKPVQRRACISLVVRYSSSDSPFGDKLLFRRGTHLFFCVFKIFLLLLKKIFLS